MGAVELTFVATDSGCLTAIRRKQPQQPNDAPM